MKPAPDDDNACYAAIDLGANSFHLVIMRPFNNGLETVAAHRQIVRFASGLKAQHPGLQPEARRRALRCLAQFRDRLRAHPVRGVRAVGTSIFRRLARDHRFLRQAEDALGCPIEVISGEEEARLIYLGATWGLQAHDRLVIDIGGGSSEVVLGRAASIDTAISLELGSASVASRYFSGPDITAADVADARAAVGQEIERQQIHRLKLPDGCLAIGSSGTAKSLSWVLRSLHLTNGDITRDGLERIEPVLWQVDNMAQLSQVLNLNIRRASVFPGGYIIMSELFRRLDLTRMSFSSRALRDGIVVTLILQDSTT